MSLVSRILQIQDIESLLSYENKKLMDTVPDEEERLFASWNSRWRKEALEHYLGLGWSFVSHDTDLKSSSAPEGQLVGYFLAQPLVFFEAQTQSLWVEHLSYSTLTARDELCSLAYKLSREKHFQRVLFPNNSSVMNSIAGFKPEAWSPSVAMVKTTR
jgi:hypothetical protein